MDIKILLIAKTKLIGLSNEDLTDTCLTQNIFISNLAIEELIRRNPKTINRTDVILNQIISKMNIEQVWELASKEKDHDLSRLASCKLNEIFEYYQRINEEYEDEKGSKIHLFK